ncbi:hypothetical protein LOC67_08105 [Stieleria sp. JC731]|uniref:hypothetical protein n=1 Tax=Pirellulaceae TaxID=2691357 RepID=UPI001E3F9A4C|nr:hypothetical protein [Stieleria sp. JC731]MCC9600521.1 hypothetical protein [Stieleria sp. JC731]
MRDRQQPRCRFPQLVPVQSVPALRTITLIVAIALVMPTIAHACNIPVFRYALERWQPDRIELIVFSAEGLPDSAQQRLRRITDMADGPDVAINVKVTVVDTAKPIDDAYGNLWKQVESKAKSLPYLVVRTKVGNGRFINHFDQPLDELNVEQLLGSPVRQELQKRLLAGHSVIWLMIKSSDEAKNAAARSMLESTFTQLESDVQLPEGIGLPGSELYADVPLVVRFSIVEIDPNDDRERFLVELFGGIRPEAFKGRQPLLVPVFGRGRALEVLSAENTTSTMVKELTQFLAGACSCQVKEQNPGFDLLIHCQWDSELFGSVENRPPDRSDVEGTNRQPTLVPIPPGRKR